MSISDNEVLKVARLAGIKILQNEVPKMVAELEKIIDFINQLNEADCKDVQPLSSITVDNMRERSDIVNDGGYVCEIMKNAPEQSSNMFVVPKVID